MSETETSTETVSKADFDREVQKRKELDAKVVHYEKTYKNINPEEHSALKTELEILRNEKAAKSGDPKDIDARIKAAETEILKRVSKDIEDRDNALKLKDSQLKELQVDSKVFTEAAGEFVQGYHPELKRMIRESCALDDEGNIIIKDEKGNTRFSPTNSAKPMTHTEFIEELKQQKDFAVIDRSLAGGKTAGEKRSGGGAKITTLSQLGLLSPEKQREALAAMTQEERVAISRTIQIR